jgi:hypothetical protein
MVCARPRISSELMAVNPTHSSVYTSTPRAPPITQASCSTDSERPNAEARDSSGRSSCSEASNDALAIALAAEVISVATAATIRLPVTAAASAATVTATAARTTSSAGLPSCRRAAAKLPPKLPMAAAAPMVPRMPSCTQPLAWCALATNAGYRNRKPTIALMVQLPHSEVMMLRPSGCRGELIGSVTASPGHAPSGPLRPW